MGRGSRFGEEGGDDPPGKEAMSVLLVTHPAYLEHESGRGHPERPERLAAVLAGVDAAGVREGIVGVSPRAATRDELARVHPAPYLDALEQFCASGGGRLDADTGAGPGSWNAAALAAGAGLEAVERLDAGEADAAFCAVRPPGHHAEPDRAMGFCLVNNVAVTAAALVERGERVLIVDWDAHHGNGTQDVFYADDRVAYVSMHQFPLYPGTGRVDDVGTGAGTGATVNLPFPPGTTGDVYLRAVDDVLLPLAESFRPSWLIVSAGFDAHRADPLTDLGLSAGDFGDLTARVTTLVPPGRRILFLEGGYDLGALRDSTAACLGALLGDRYRPEPATSGGPGQEVVDAARSLRPG